MHRRGGRAFAIASLGALAACRFDPAGVAGDDVAVDAPADAPGDGPVDAAICPAPVARITVDGIPHEGVGAPATRVLVGDTVALSSQGSCGPTPLTYRWQVSPVDGIRDTIAPADDAAAITVYATLPDQYSVTLTVRDAQGGSDTATIYGFDAVGFAAVDGAPDKVRDLDVGGGRLWLGTDTGAWRADLGAPTVFTSVNGEVVGGGPNALPAKVEAIAWDDARSVLWVGSPDSGRGVWRVSFGAIPMAQPVLFDAVLGGDAKVDDVALVIEPTAGTVAVATDRGLALSPDGAAFTAVFTDGSPVAAAAETAETWALDARLHSLDAGDAIAVFDGGSPTALAAAPDGAVWVAAEGKGVARVERVGAGVAIDPYDDASGLPSKDARGLWIERPGAFPGDVWVATQKGLARWKADRGVWVTYGNLQGLMGHLDLRAVAVRADGDGRAVVAGGNAGLVYAAVP